MRENMNEQLNKELSKGLSTKPGKESGKRLPRPGGSLILVNHDHPLQQDTTPCCVPILESYPAVTMERRAAACLLQLLRAINAGDEIVPVSGYRSFAEQVQIYQDSLVENGADFTAKYVAKPGCSEHQSGLAIDLAKKAPEIDFICPDFPETGICGDFRKAASRYGFIQRYTAEKEHITGIACEPWHFRYVGYPHSEIMVQMNFCLEEYIDYLHGFTYAQPLTLRRGGRNISVFFSEADMTVEAGETIETGKTNCKFANSPIDLWAADNITEVSENNVDGCITTVWN